MVMHQPKDAWFSRIFSREGMKVIFFTALFLLFSFTAVEGKNDDEYTINFNNVSIEEYVRFVSKITNINFIYQEDDMNFSVTVVSEDPTTPENVMSTLAQILRINGLTMLEQDGNLVIHKNPNVKQFAKLVFDGEKIDKRYPLVTKVFSIKNEKAEAVEAIIKPMISQDAILDISVATNQLILTDITANVEKVSLLIENLDSPSSPLTVETYKVKHNSPEFLISVASQIITPLAQGNPFLMVPQPRTNIIFLVSTPALIDKGVSVLHSLDSAPKSKKGIEELKPENVFIYKTKFHSPSDIADSLRNMAKDMEKSGYIESGFLKTIESVYVVKETNSLLFTGDAPSLTKVREILDILDSATSDEAAEMQDSFYLYKPKNKTPKELKKAINELIDSLEESKMGNQQILSILKNAQVVSLIQSLVFSGDPVAFNKIKEILASLDTPCGAETSTESSFYLYQLQHIDPDTLKTVLMDMAKNLNKSGICEEGLVDVIRSMKYVKGSGSVLFTGNKNALKRLEEALPSIDKKSMIGGGLSSRSQFFVYKPKFVSGEDIEDSLKEYGDSFEDAHLADNALLRAIQSMKYVKSTNSLLFTGDPETLNKLEGLIATIDVKGGIAEKEFYLYQLQYVTKDQLENYLDQIAKNLNRKEHSQKNLYDTIESMKWVDQSHSFMFKGDQTSIEKIKKLLQEFDTAEQKKAPGQSTFLMYELKHVSENQMDSFLQEVSRNLKASDIGEDNLIETIRSRKWIPQSQSYMFSGSQDTLQRLQKILEDFDVVSESRRKTTYFVYHLKKVQGPLVEERLEEFAKKMKASGLRNTGVLKVIENIKYIKETNSLLLTGDEKSIEEVKILIEEYDTGEAVSIASDFFMYRPQYIPAEQIEDQLKDIGDNLKKGNLADDALLQAISTVHFSDQNKALIFTGPPEALQKVEGLIKEIDVPGDAEPGIQQMGQVTFLLYKLKFASGPNIVQSIQGVADDLKRSRAEPGFLTALQSMKYIKETNSLLFTGTQEALEKVQKLVEKFDVPGEDADFEGPSTYFVYKPEYVAGPELEQLLKDFINHLSATGLADPSLFQAVRSAKWVEKTNSLIFTGSAEAVGKIKELLRSFDVPGGEGLTPTAIQDLDSTSFLVYKLQYHKGDEIQGALRQIGQDLIENKSKLNENLLQAIQSIQWLKVTNSLLCTGDQSTLTRLKELIKNLDVPLKQVFIEILVIRTTLTNMLNIGLDWGSKFKVKDKFAGNLSNISNNTLNNNPQFVSGFNSVNATRFPQTTDTGLNSGLDLGIIGDIIWHKGRSFVSLASLLRALQQDSETSIVLTPKILTQDNRTSSIFIGQNIPYVGSFVSNTGNNATVQTTNLEYRDVGVNLVITPVLGNSDIVTLDIQLENSTVATDAEGNLTINTDNTIVNGITTDRTTMNTTVHVPNQSFLVLSGNVDILKSRSREGIPCLGGIPYLGAAFSQLINSDTRNNLVIFIKPHIITSHRDIMELTRSQEDLYRENAGSGDLEYDVDEGMELLKSFDDE